MRRLSNPQKSNFVSQRRKSLSLQRYSVNPLFLFRRSAAENSCRRKSLFNILPRSRFFPPPKKGTAETGKRCIVFPSSPLLPFSLPPPLFHQSEKNPSASNPKPLLFAVGGDGTSLALFLFVLLFPILFPSPLRKLRSDPNQSPQSITLSPSLLPPLHFLPPFSSNQTQADASQIPRGGGNSRRKKKTLLLEPPHRSAVPILFPFLCAGRVFVPSGSGY